MQKRVLLRSSRVLPTVQGKGSDAWRLWARRRSSQGSVFLEIKSTAAFLAGEAEQFPPGDGPQQFYQTGLSENFPLKDTGRSKVTGFGISGRKERGIQQLPPFQAMKGKCGRIARDDAFASWPQSCISLNPGGLWICIFFFAPGHGVSALSVYTRSLMWALSLPRLGWAVSEAGVGHGGRVALHHRLWEEHQDSNPSLPCEEQTADRRCPYSPCSLTNHGTAVQVVEDILTVSSFSPCLRPVRRNTVDLQQSCAQALCTGPDLPLQKGARQQHNTTHAPFTPLNCSYSGPEHLIKHPPGWAQPHPGKKPPTYHMSVARFTRSRWSRVLQ